MPDYVKRASTPPRYSAHRYQYGEPVDGELLEIIRRGAVDAEAVEVPEWQSLLIKAGRDVTLVADGTWLVYEHDRGYLTAWDDDEFRDEFTDAG